MNLKIVPVVFMAVLALCRPVPAAASLFETESSQNTEAQNQEVILLTHSSDSESFTNQVAELFGEYLAEESEGHFQVEIYPSDTLGGLSEVGYSLKAGTVQMRFGPGPARIPMLLCYRCLTGMTLEELKDALQSEPLQDLINREAARYGVRNLGFLPPSYRILSSNRKITTMEDLKGLKIRTYNNATTETIWTALEALPSVYAYSEVYSAMQSGLVEANPEATLQDFISMGFYEQQKYVINICQQIYLEPVYISQKYYDSLDEDERSQIEKAAERALTDAEPLLEGIHARARATLTQAGVEWIDLSEEEQERMLAKIGDPVEALFRETVGDTLIDDLQEAVKEAKTRR